MGFWETAGKVTGAVVKGTAGYLESQARSCTSRKGVYTDEQIDTFNNFADGMHGIKENGLFSGGSNYYDD